MLCRVVDPNKPLSGKEKDDEYISTKPSGRVNLRAATISKFQRTSVRPWCSAHA
jgi:hypothetical protein